MIDDRVTHVFVSMLEIPLTGRYNLLVRLQESDRDLITHAALVAGMTQQKFVRTLLVNAAKKVLTEAGVKPNA